jgi:hypothetical protein
MSDIVERLRSERDEHRQSALNAIEGFRQETERNARLRAALERIADHFPDDCHKFQTTEAVNMKEIAREALEGDDERPN